MNAEEKFLIDIGLLARCHLGEMLGNLFVASCDADHDSPGMASVICSAIAHASSARFSQYFGSLGTLRFIAQTAINFCDFLS
jgi:hypothetical protein